MTKTWLIYALGGGWGHINRALSLGRIALNQRSIEIITNSPYAQYISKQDCLLHQIADSDSFAATCWKVREIFNTNATRYNCLIIDTFPRGLGGELADILPQLHNIPKILIHRDINPRYVEVKNLRSFVTENFQAVIIPGEGKDLPLGDLPGVIHTAPWLIRHPEELPDRKIVRSQILKVDDSRKIILVCAAGQISELPLFTQLTLQLHTAFPECAVRILSPHCPSEDLRNFWLFHHPGIECFAAADIVVGSAGYNTVYECTSVGVPLVALPLPRLYDRQQQRANKVYQVRNIPDALFTVKQILDTVKDRQLIPNYINGAIAAVHHITNFEL
ncbi:UDP-N-acetylglucosamine--LPS N-acetylglucosamine transferase [Nostoc sp. CENA543]|uniref:glycosyltransferase n=1 Tax=Nostoc sp. CENA543 TaxID=1869241 RepID=UPI000CA3479A|nr:glycosyltransferase [Nostoc sp. CENA543]AUS99118.1 UDP-N-acetylglucosamine--LPS N-acetylglucosamine transferase [Nostoc sp. CENA543]